MNEEAYPCAECGVGFAKPPYRVCPDCLGNLVTDFVEEMKNIAAEEKSAAVNRMLAGSEE